MNTQAKEEKTQQAKKSMKRCPISLVIKEMQTKLTLRYHESLELKSWMSPSADKNAEQILIILQSQFKFPQSLWRLVLQNLVKVRWA